MEQAQRITETKKQAVHEELLRKVTAKEVGSDLCMVWDWCVMTVSTPEMTHSIKLVCSLHSKLYFRKFSLLFLILLKVVVEELWLPL